MSIEDKLTTIAENVPKVYAAGQKSMVDESKIIEKTASGKIISLNDVSEIPHEVSIQLSVENLFEYGTKTDYIRKDGLLEIVGDTIRYRQMASGGTVFVNGKRYLPGAYTVWAKTTCENGITRPLLFLYDGNGELLTGGSVQIPSFIYNAYYKGWFYEGSNITFTIPETVSYWCLGFAPEGGVINSYYDLYDVILYTQPHTATDFSGVTVKVCGKNLSGKKVINKYNYSLDYKKYNEENAIVLPKGTYCISGTPTPILQFFDVDSKAQLLVDEAVTFSGGYYKGWDGFALVPSADIYLLSVFSLKRTAIVTMCGQNKELTDVQIEVGTSKTTYEAPTEIKEYVPNASGVVDGITSMSPNMTVFTDNADVNITVKYHKSWGMQTEYDRFWDEVQNKGEWMNYSYVFCGPSWNDITFKPKYDIKFSGSAAFAFARTGIKNLEARLNDRGVVLDTSGLTSADNLFGTSSLAIIPELDFSKVTTSTSGCFINCKSLVIVRKLKMSENTVIATNMFSGCTELQNIIFDGTIAKSGINLQWPTKLSRESIESLVGVYAQDAVVSATLSKTAVNTAFETSAGAADGSTSEAWLALLATKPNLTISLV